MTIGGGTLLSDRFGNAIARRPTHGRRVCFPRGSRAAPERPLDGVQRALAQRTSQPSSLPRARTSKALP